MVHSAAIMFGGAAALSIVEAFTPGGPTTSLLPGLAAVVFALVVLFGAQRLPVASLAALGPIGAALIAYALSTTPGAGDGAVLYVWPVLWEAYFFGRRATVLIVAWVGLVHGLTLLSLPPEVGYFDRWIDVVVSVGVVAAVVELLAHRNRQLVARLSSEAQVDKLTGLLNRRGFEERAGQELARARRDHSSVGVISFDLDHFKQVNDVSGHDAGDRTLIRVGEELREAARESDVLARMGGEEFVALVPGGVAEARTFAERVRAGMEASVDPATLGVTVSAGVAAEVAPADLERLLTRADAALYAAKAAGRNRTVIDHDVLEALTPA
ncbi:MAG: GGDEF domain-containing protein [Solirubrobacterales bacterium]